MTFIPPISGSPPSNMNEDPENQRVKRQKKGDSNENPSPMELEKKELTISQQEAAWALFDAIAKQDPTKLKTFISNGGSLCLLNSTGKSPILQGISKWPLSLNQPRREILEILKENKQVFNSSKDFCRLLLQHLLIKIRMDLDNPEFFAGFWLREVIDLSQHQDIPWSHLLFSLCYNEDFAFKTYDLIEFIFSKGCSSDVVDEDGNNPLQYLLSQLPGTYKEKDQETKIYRLLIEHGAKISETNKKGFAPLCFGFTRLKGLVNQGEDQDLNHSLLIKRDVRISQLKYLISKGASVNVSCAEDSRQFVHVLIDEYQIGLFNDILDKLSNPNAQNKNFETPLLMLCKQLDQLDVQELEKSIERLIILLKEKEQSLDIPDTEGYTPLHWAILRGNIKIAKLLKENGADSSKKTVNDETLIHLAVTKESKECLEYVLKLADVNARTKDGKTALDIAAEVHAVECASILLSGKTDQGNIDSAFNIAFEKCDVTLVKKFLEFNGWLNVEQKERLPQILFAEIFSKLFDETSPSPEILEKLKFKLNLCFLNSDLEDMRYLMEGLIKCLDQSSLSEKEKMREYLLEVCGGFFTWGSLVSRFRKEIHQKGILQNYGKKGAEKDAFVEQQVNFGTHCFNWVWEALIQVKTGKSDYQDIINDFAEKRSSLQKNQNPNSNTWLDFKTWRGGKRSFGSFFESPLDTPLGNQNNRYSIFEDLCREVFKQSSKILSLWTSSEKETLEGHNSNYRLITKDIKMLTDICCIKCPGRRVMLWNHAPTHEMKNLIEDIEAFHKKIFTSKTDSEEVMMKETIPHANWLMSNSMLTNRGFAQYSLMWLLLAYLFHGKVLPPITLAASQLDCNLISIPLEFVKDRFPTFFEKVDINIDMDSVKSVKDYQIAVARKFLAL